jgi:glycosyltransferase involved in cell wall biosynthesis
MKVLVCLEQRFTKTPNGSIYTSGAGDYAFWQRYLSVFEMVEVLARVENVSSADLTWRRADGPRVNFIPLPYYLGPYQYLCNAREINDIAKAVVQGAENVLLRAPGQVSSSIFHLLKKYQHPYGVEVVGDPYDAFAKGSIDHLFRRFFRWLGAKQVRQQCKGALGAAYVTEKILQKRYPNGFFSTHYSSIDIGKEAYVSSPRVEFGEEGEFKLVFVGSLAQLYKSPDVLINAVSVCLEKGHKLKLKIIGDGKFRPQLETQAARLGPNIDSITFLGQLPGNAVRMELLQADLFVLPSRTEGLPRAMIEAMACGLPCIGSAVGGIPELLPGSDLVPPGDAQALADKIIEVLNDSERMRSMSARNLEKAKEYRKDILDLRRREFYLHLRSQTEAWLQARDIRP